MVMEIDSPEESSSVKPLFRAWEFCPENVLHEDDLLILHLPQRLTIYSSESKEFLREIHFPLPLSIWRIWKDEEAFRGISDRGLFSFFPDSGKVLMDEALPEGEKWVQGIQVGSKAMVLVKEDLSLHKWLPGEGECSFLCKSHVGTSVKGNNLLLDGNPELLAYAEEFPKGTVHLHMLRSSTEKWSTRLSSSVSVLSVHPNEEKVAIGDKKGRVFIWSPLANGSFSHSLFHWHSSSVYSLAWSMDSSLLSGGREEVLIKWSFKHKNPVATVPRLGGTVTGIFLCKGLAFLSLSNNSLQIFERTGLSKKGHLAGPDFGSLSNHFAWFEPYEALVFSHARTTLQFLNPRTRKEVLRLEIFQENKIASLRNKKSGGNPPSGRLHFDISSDNKWLATGRKDDKVLKLSLWKFSLEDIKPFSLRASWSEPECFRDIQVSIKFIQSQQQLLVLGTGNAAKLWQIDEDEQIYWIKSFTYKNHSPSAVSSSEDGSVLAIAFKNAITLWRNDGTRFGLITSLSGSSPVCSLLFGRGRNAGVLFSSSDSRVCVWDVLHMKLRRNIPFEKPLLLSTPDKRIAVKDKKGVYVYDADGMRSRIYSGDLTAMLFTSSSSGVIHCYVHTPQGVLGRIKWNHQMEEEEVEEEDSNKENEGHKHNSTSSLSSSSSRFTPLKKETFAKDPSLFFENVQFPLSAFAIDFLDKGVTMFRDTFLYE